MLNTKDEAEAAPCCAVVTIRFMELFDAVIIMMNEADLQTAQNMVIERLEAEALEAIRANARK